MIISEANSCVNDNTEQSKNQEQKLGYVYRHIRLDTNMPFYIGIGKVDGGENKRANDKISRSKEWINVVSITEYRVDIILENVPIFILGNKEKYFIKLYGRIDLGTGTLVNKTSGGQGTNGRTYKATEETRKKQSEAQKGKKNALGYKHSVESLKKITNSKKFSFKKVGQYKDGNLIKEYHSIASTKIDGFIPEYVGNCCRGKQKSYKGFQWKFL